MEQKLSQNNITFSFPNVMFISAVIALIVIVGITIAFSQPVSSKADETIYP
jgi:septal ring-binding cell division protein DamX